MKTAHEQQPSPAEFYREVSRHFEQIYPVELSWRHASRKEVWDMQRAGTSARDCALEIGKQQGLKAKE